MSNKEVLKRQEELLLESILVGLKKYKFRYKGKRYVVIEKPFKSKANGARRTRNGVIRIIINSNLSPAKKNLELHRLITGRGLSLYDENFKRIGRFIQK